ncbi:MAG: hypothetical protein ACI4UA_08260 [Bacteroidaceae bacterium]
MFVRRKKNRSGTISVVVVDKHGGKFKELHTIGVAHDELEADSLCEQGRRWINTHLGIKEIDFDKPTRKDDEKAMAHAMLDNIDSVLLNGA